MQCLAPLYEPTHSPPLPFESFVLLPPSTCTTPAPPLPLTPPVLSPTLPHRPWYVQDVFEHVTPVEYTVTALSRCSLLSITRNELRDIFST